MNPRKDLRKRYSKVITNLKSVEFERLYYKYKLIYKKNKHNWNPSKKYYSNGFTYTQNDIDMFDSEYSKLSNFNIIDQLFYSPAPNQIVNQSNNTSQIVNQSDNTSEIVNQSDTTSEIINQSNNKSEIVNQFENKSKIVYQSDIEIVEKVNTNVNSNLVDNNRKTLVKKYNSTINKRSDTLRSKRLAKINKKKK